MSASYSSQIIVLPGANDKIFDPAIFGADESDLSRFHTIRYPGWRRYIAKGFSAEALIADLTAQIEVIVPIAPILILGFSIGGHFGYAAALRLQASGHQIAGFCAIDTFMIASSAPRPGWKGRALALALKLLSKRRIADLGNLLRSRLWRALFRLSGSHLSSVLRALSSSDRFSSVIESDRVVDEELSMRLLLREVAPWIASLDLRPVALHAPTVLIRTKESAVDDLAWRRRCPNIEVVEIPGTHQTILDPENVSVLRKSFLGATREWRAPTESKPPNIIEN